jgi:hypothetical protein
VPDVSTKLEGENVSPCGGTGATPIRTTLDVTGLPELLADIVNASTLVVCVGVPEISQFTLLKMRPVASVIDGVMEQLVTAPPEYVGAIAFSFPSVK